MNIQAALDGKAILDIAETASTAFVDGTLSPDHNSNYVRAYPSRKHKTTYYLMKKADILNTHKWSSDELINNGFIGEERFRLFMAVGTLIQLVTVTHHRVGEGHSGKLHPYSICRADSQCSASEPCMDVDDDGFGVCDNCCVA
jgi:hypothetical protein